MMRDEAHSLPMVHGDRCRNVVESAGIDKNQAPFESRRSYLQDMLRIEGDNDQPVDASHSSEEVQVRPDLVRALDIVDDERVVGGGRCLLDTTEDLDEVMLREEGDDDADGLRP